MLLVCLYKYCTNILIYQIFYILFYFVISIIFLIICTYEFISLYIPAKASSNTTIASIHTISSGLKVSIKVNYSGLFAIQEFSQNQL